MKTITPTIPQLRMLASIRGKQWLVMESQLPAFALAALDATGPREGISISMEDCFELRPESTIDGEGIATIHIHATLIDSCPPIYEKLGLVTRYETIQGEIKSAMESGAKGILFIVDSPGGTVSGNVECADFIASLPLPTVAFCKGLACSAAYKISAGCGYIIASQSATVGNIGTILSWADCSEMWKEMGIEFKAITSEGADLKSTFHLEPNADQLAFLQEEINRAGEQFRQHVIAGRGAAGATLDDEIWRAGWYSGERAGMLGLIDDIGTEDDAREVLIGMMQVI